MIKLLLVVFSVYIPHRYKTQEICYNVVSEDPFMLVYSCSRYKTQQMSDEADDDF